MCVSVYTHVSIRVCHKNNWTPLVLRYSNSIESFVIRWLVYYAIDWIIIGNKNQIIVSSMELSHTRRDAGWPSKKHITKTRLCKLNPVKPHFYIIWVKLGFTGVDIIFHIPAQNIDCEYSLEPPRIYLTLMEFTVDSRYIEVQETLWNTSRYPYLNISQFAELRKNESNNHISQVNMQFDSWN